MLLDNVEWALRVDPHGTRSTIKALHDYTKHVRLLATSRQRIGLPGLEATVRVNPLTHDDAEELLQNLLTTNAVIIKKTDSDTLRDLLALFDGLPLAIILGSATIADSGIGTFLNEWKNAKTALLEIPGVPLESQDSLSSVSFSITLSLSDLMETQLDCLGGLALFPAGLTWEMGNKLYGTPEFGQAVRVLVAKSLAYEANGRIKILVPVREYVLGIVSHDSIRRIANRALSLFGQLVADKAPAIFRRGGRMALHQLTDEMPNINYILGKQIEWAKTTSENVDAITNLVLALAPYYRVKGFYDEASIHFQRAGKLRNLTEYDEELAHICRATSRLQEARSFYGLAIEQYRNIGNRTGESICLRRLADVLRMQGKYDKASESVQKAREILNGDDILGTADCIETLADIQRMRGDDKQSLSGYQQALSLYRNIGAELGVANCLKNICQVKLLAGDREEAAQYILESLSLCREIGDLEGMGNANLFIARLELASGKYDTVEDKLEEARRQFSDIDGKLGLAIADYLQGCLDLLRGKREGARVLLGQARRGFEETNVRLNMCLADAAMELTSKDQKMLSASIAHEFERLTGRKLRPEYIHHWPLEVRGSVLHQLS
uniref:Tetratricopeptide repeat-containing protein n=1 Tax=Candidatus Kentrum sp. MB TaxID=2138164 RepID=A0A451BE43_9GAMM|nr:MAG: Tetratricopeptide repeat-containing protein [Candidatus Kentron sp. MB]VFK32803.1 MAG: Tetratricopeptide repeat-containing protein [Candidatus Kentron sp. MB]VFK76554.1 MAG: Tetratricopeptide repeat-containing protein [Candidatus Kentron sp. MB]